jgi:hypothetical protein
MILLLYRSQNMAVHQSYLPWGKHHLQVLVKQTNKQTNKLTPWGRILCKNLTVPQSVKKLPHIMNPKIHCHIHNDPQLLIIERKNNPVHAFPSYSFKIQFNIILPSLARYLVCFFFFRISHKQPYIQFHDPQVVYASPTSSLFDHLITFAWSMN